MSTNDNENSIDATTISYLKGQISFQDYETLMEKKSIEEGLSNDRTSAINFIEETYDSSQNQYVYDINTDIQSNTLTTVDLSLLKPFSNRKHNSHSSSSNTSSLKSYPMMSKKCQKPDGTKKFKDRFLNLKDILSSNEDTDGDNEDDPKSSSNFN